MQWIAIIVVPKAIALSYMDRSTQAIGNLKIREEFGIDTIAIGFAMTTVIDERELEKYATAPA